MSNCAYSDRICPPGQTLERIAPHLASYGITRLARQTSLDTIGIPVFASFRPNALTLATNQGKGITDDAAKASAAMEALEFAIAEQPECEIVRDTARNLLAKGVAVVRPTRCLPAGTAFPNDRTMAWLRGRNLFTGASCLVPLDVVRFAGRADDLPGICQHTNGLASGNSEQEAIFHGLCELVERDAGTLWAITPPEARRRRRIALASLDDPQVVALAAKVAAADCSLTLYDQTSDLGIPTIYTEIWPNQSSPGLFDVSSGSGTHPVAARAAIRAITEAAQSRVTTIAAARDDIDPDGYAMAADGAPSSGDGEPDRSLPPGLDLGTPLPSLIDHVLRRLAVAGLTNVLCVPLGGEKAGISVVRVLADELEDWGVNLNWAPGARALASLASAGN